MIVVRQFLHVLAYMRQNFFVTGGAVGLAKIAGDSITQYKLLLGIERRRYEPGLMIGVDDLHLYQGRLGMSRMAACEGVISIGRVLNTLLFEI